MTEYYGNERPKNSLKIGNVFFLSVSIIRSRIDEIRYDRVARDVKGRIGPRVRS